MKTMLVPLLLLLSSSLSLAQPRVVPSCVFNCPVLQEGESSAAGPGWQWFVFDVSGPKTGEPDLLAYHRETGLYVLAITDHPQFSEFEGSVQKPGDCYLVGQLPPNRDLTVGDLDRDGAPDLFAYDPVNGKITRFYFRSVGKCDWTDAF